LKYKEPTPDIYKVVYKLSRWKTRSERYFTAFSTQRAFDEFLYVFETGHVNSNRVTIFDIIRYNRFADKWYSVVDEINKIPEQAKQTKKGYLILTR
jgi:hypothetical protein